MDLRELQAKKLFIEWGRVMAIGDQSRKLQAAIQLGRAIDRHVTTYRSVYLALDTPEANRADNMSA